MARRWLVVAFLAGAMLGVALAINAGLILMLFDDRLLWLVPIIGVCGLVVLAGAHALLLRQDSCLMPLDG